MSVTVVVPMHNAAPTIGRCLDSIHAQTKRPEKVVVVDDGSTDGSADVVRDHPLPGLVVVSSPIGRGPGAARNDGAQRASTEWLAFLDADNEWQPEFLQEVCAAIANLNAAYGSPGGTPRLVSPRPANVRRILSGGPVTAERSRDFRRIALRFLPVAPPSLVRRR